MRTKIKNDDRLGVHSLVWQGAGRDVKTVGDVWGPKFQNRSDMALNRQKATNRISPNSDAVQTSLDFHGKKKFVFL